jgi:hypothetical protein
VNIDSPRCLQLIIAVNAGTATADDVSAAMDELSALKTLLKTLEAGTEAAAAAFVTANGPVRMGKIEWRMTTAKTIKCNDPAATMGTLLELTDVDTLADCLSSNAFKVAPVRNVLGPAFDEHFTTTAKQDLEGKPLKELTRIDTTFTKGNK